VLNDDGGVRAGMVIFFIVWGGRERAGIRGRVLGEEEGDHGRGQNGYQHQN